MKLLIKGLPFAAWGDNLTSEEGAQEFSKEHDVLAFISKEHGGGGYPEIDLIATPEQVVKLLTEDDTAWSTGDPEMDAEQLFYAFREAQVVMK